MIVWWWLLPALAVGAVLGMWFTGGRWQRAWIARDNARPAPSPYRELGVCRTCGYVIRPLLDHGWEHVGNHGKRLHAPDPAVDHHSTEGGK